MNFLIYSYISTIMILMLEKIRNMLMSSNRFWSLAFCGILTTFPHELAHYIVAFITGGKPEGISLLPKKEIENGNIYWRLGYVRAYIGKINGFWIGIAPIVWIIVGFLVAKYFFMYFEVNCMNTLLFYFIEYLCITNGIPSKQDLKVAFSSNLIVNLIIIIIGGLIWKKLI